MVLIIRVRVYTVPSSHRQVTYLTRPGSRVGVIGLLKLAV